MPLPPLPGADAPVESPPAPTHDQNAGDQQKPDQGGDVVERLTRIEQLLMDLKDEQRADGSSSPQRDEPMGDDNDADRLTDLERASKAQGEQMDELLALVKELPTTMLGLLGPRGAGTGNTE